MDVTPNMVSRAATTYDSFTYGQGGTATATRMNVTATREYGYGSGAYGSLVRRVVNTYLHESDSNYLQRHILDRVASRKIYSGETEGTLKAKSEFEYDSSDLSITGTSGAVQHDYTNYSNSFRYRGNLTRTKNWSDTSSGWLVTTNWYNDLGNRIQTQDPRSKNAHFYYTDSWASSTCAPASGSSQAFITQMTNPLSQTVSTSYYSCSSLVGSVTDANNRSTSYSYDEMDRITGIVRADGGETSYDYDDTNRKITIWGDLNDQGDQDLKTEIIYDGLERTIETRQYEPGGCYIAAKTGVPGTRVGYDAYGRALAVTNPYRPTCSESPVWTASVYDALGRVTSVTTETDSAEVLSAYSGNVTTVTDQAGKLRRSTTDALGRLVKLEEMSSSSSVYAETDYTYDVLDNLLTTSQVNQTRTFTYDSLGRLTSADNPESGTIYYQYDSNGNLTQKTDALGTVTTYAYDDINRITSRSYNDGTATVTFAYDDSNVDNSIGRLTPVSSTVSTYTYDQYDEVGRVQQTTQTTGSAGPFTINYAYNLAGGLIQEYYPSGRTVYTDYDTAGRVSQVAGTKSGESNRTYASSFSYWPHGAVKSVALGNGKWEHTAFNDRLQPTAIGLGTSSTDSSILGLSYGYGSSDNNGNMVSQTISAPGPHTWSQSYSYDQVNRLSEATESSVWSQTYSYDQYGNRAVTAGNILDSTLTPRYLSDYEGTNRLKESLGWHYDYAGNILTDRAGNTFTYDAENRQKTFNSTAGTYSYDGEGRRVKKTDSSGTTVFVYDAMGRLLAEYADQTMQGSGGTHYLTQDHLGSTRVVTDSSGSVIARHDYLPFGEEIPASWGSRNAVTGYGASDSTRQRFSGKERDAESNLDYFGARYFSGAQGRFTSADAPFADKDPADPQSWNRYVYTRNDPLRYIDPDGAAIFESARKLAEAGQSVMSAAHLQPLYDDNGKLVQTYCNFGVQSILHKAGDHTLDNMTASQMTEYLADPKNATAVSFSDAVSYAKQGVTIIMAESTHVAIVAPAEMVPSGNSWGKQAVPQVLNVGKENIQMALDLAFGKHRSVQAYILSADKAELEKRQKELQSSSKTASPQSGSWWKKLLDKIVG